MLCHEDILSFEEMRMIVEAAAQLGVKKVRLTGGEPLVRRGIVDLTRMISAVDGIEEVVMTTNATLLAPLAKDLKAAGLSRLNISLDTLDPKRYARLSRTGTLDDALAGIAAAREAGFTHTKFNAVLLGGLNEDEIRPLAEMAKNEPVDVRMLKMADRAFCECRLRARCVAGTYTAWLRRCGGAVWRARLAGEGGTYPPHDAYVLQLLRQDPRDRRRYVKALLAFGP